MNKIVRISLILLLAGLSTLKLFAQTAPNIGYSNPHTWRVGTVINPIGPSNTGGAGSVNGQTSTFAGNGTAGSINNANPLLAEFSNPYGLAQDAQNNIYVADGATHVIRKITPAGAVTTFAGVAGSHGTTNGAGTVAKFYGPRGMAVDAAGNLYVADYNNNMIRKITPAGVVSTVAGSTVAGTTDGQDTSARFTGPTDVAVDVAGNLFVADYGGNKIRKITPDGMVSTYAGTGVAGNSNGTSALTATLHQPYGVVVDAADNLYITDRSNHKIRVVTPNNTIYTLAGSGTAGFADSTIPLNAKFNSPCGITIDKIGNLYVGDEMNQRIRKITPAGVVTTVAGSGAVGSNNAAGDSSTFDNPFSVLADNDGGYVYVGSQDNLIRKVAITPYTITPDLPLGLNFDSNNGAIYGTPQVSQAQTTYVVTEYNATGIDTAHVIFTIGSPNALVLSDQNYIATYVPRVSGITTNGAITSNNRNPSAEEISVAYFDGLGRPMQNVQVKGSPAGYDIIQPVAYDQYGREAVKYLPYRTTSTSYGSYRATATTDINTFYTTPPSGVSTDSYPSATTGFEPSPLNRMVEQGAPGTAWQMPGTGDPNSAGHTIKALYQSNDQTSTFSNVPGISNMGSHIVALYKTTRNTDQSETLTRTSNATYSPATLYLTVTRDENWDPTKNGCEGSTEEYKDLEGHVVLKRTYNYLPAQTSPAVPAALQMLSTYYIYDDFGNLAFVLPPLANADAASSISQTTLDNLCYQYRYDERNRLIQKKLPGKGWEYMVYNLLDQVIFTQDANQLSRGGEASFIKYDAQGRVIMTGIEPGHTESRDILQSTVTNILTTGSDGSTEWETRSTAGTTGYTNTAIPYGPTTKVLTINYYDDYNNIPGLTLPSSFTVPLAYNASPTGMLTATKTAVLNTPANMLWSVHYYDGLGRNIESYQQHYYAGTLSFNNYDDISTTYDFTNTPTNVTRQHWNTGSTSVPLVTVANTYMYDNMGRKLMSWEQITNGNSVPTANTMISKIDYNEIGQVWKKHLHSTNWTTWLQDISYDYNERGWLRHNNSSLFGEELRYNTPDAGANQYNGNISEEIYTKTGAGSFTTLYGYDKLNRLLTAGSSENLSETISYDLNGNINSLTRTGPSAATLTYNYLNGNGNSNQLATVYNGASAFRTYGTYDPNGNAPSDGAVTSPKSITYNMLNLPQTVIKSGTTLATYTYDAGGNKLANKGSDGYWDYINGIVYNGTTVAAETIQFIQTEEGRVIPQSGDWHYEYTIKDHLGNARLSFDADPTSGTARRLQEDGYYAFGLRSPIYDYSNNNRYLYNGKELQTDLTNQYDYGARFYDPVIGRWGVIDGKAEKFPNMSSYAYAGNNPIVFLDPDGNDLVYFNSKGQEINRTSSNTEFKTYVDLGNGYQEASMPKIIKGYESPVFQKYDYNIAAQTFIFNHLATDQLPKTPGGNSLTGNRPDDLDPTLVKAMITQETNDGTLEGEHGQKGKSDIMQANVTTTSGQTDWSAEKKDWGLAKGKSATPNQSVYAGIRLLYTKGLKTTTKDGQVISVTWRGDDWNEAIKRYNGGGDKNYLKEVLNYFLNATDPTPNNYVKEKKK